jgi:penicillin-binding protein 2
MAQVKKALPQIAEGLGISPDDIRQQLDASKHLAKYDPIVIKPEATQADIAYIESHRLDLPMLEMISMSRRRYPSDGFLASAIGYVGEVSENEIDASDGKLRPGDMSGKAGLEKQYNDVLMGTDGLRRVIVNSVGKETGRLDQTEAIPGKPITLTIDYDLQVAAEASLAGRKGAVVAMNPQTGEILAFVSRPTPDPNAFAVRVSKQEWQRLNSDPDLPLMNRVIQAQLAPGSVFKVIVGTAMLETKAVPESFTVFCPGQAVIFGSVRHCWQPKGHGTVELGKAIAQSCDIYFYNLGLKLGIDRMSYYGMSVGLGKRTGIDLPSEEPGLMPSEEWARRVQHRQWMVGENTSVGVGQGAIETTPIQLAKAIGGIAMGGVFKQPHLLKTSGLVPETRFPISEDTVEKITQYMEDVVKPGGTAYQNAHLEGIEMCGKSGSAQVISAAGLAKAKNKADFKDNAWFVGFAPRRNPEIVVSVLVQSTNLHGGEVAAPIARDVVKAYFDKKNKKNGQQLTAVSTTPPAPKIPAQSPLKSQAQPQTPERKPAPSAPSPDALLQSKNPDGAGKPTHQPR